MRTKQLCNDSWLFHDGEFSDPVPPYQTMKYFQAKCERATYGPAAVDPALAYETVSSHVWRTVTLPHDYIIEQSPQKQFNHSEGYFDYHNAWYRKHLFLSAEDATRRITLLFEGIATHATVYVNGCLLARNFCGYTSFEVDITDVARFDADNVIAVYVDSSSSFEGWWYQGGGIYRNVWLIKTEKLSVDLWGVQVCPQHLGNEVWDTDVTVTLRNDDLIDQAAAVRLEVLDEAGQCVAQSETSACVPSMAQATVCACLRVTAPKRWDILSPILYTLQTTVLASGAAVDCVRDTFGFRTIALDGQRGFFLNGRSVKLQGVCCHQDYGLTGKVLPDRVAEYRLRLLREMGANAYRTSHYPQGEATMDALDRLGFLVMAETRWFESTDTGMAQLAMLLKRDRNHPSIILWSVGNEEPLHAKPQGARIAQRMQTFVHQMDPSRPVTSAVSHDPLHSPALDVLDVVTVNYNYDTHDGLHEKYPDKAMVMGESCATGTSRGWYRDDDPTRAMIHALDHQTNEAFRSRAFTWQHIMARPWMMGAFQWAGIEHRGECVWPRLCSQSGALDLFLQRKDAFYQNQSHWTDAPMVHVMPHWNLSACPGDPICVWAYTNCEEVALYLGDVCLGVVHPDPYQPATWQVPYAPGRLTARAFRGGVEVATDTVETSGPAVRLRLHVDAAAQVADGQDVAVVHCDCVDAQDRVVPDAAPLLRFYTNHRGQIWGTGSDIADHTPVSSSERRMRAGLCAACIRTCREPGELVIEVEADGLIPARTTMTLCAPEGIASL